MNAAFRNAAVVSHSSVDAREAMTLCELLEAQGLRCWIAPRDMTPGSDYSDEIVRAIEGAAAMVVLLSRSANLSAHVLREVEQAVRLGRPIFPLVAQDVRLSRRLDYFLRPLHWLQYDPDALGEHAASLAKAMRHGGDLGGDDMPPSVARSLRFRPWTAAVLPFVGSLVAGLLLLGAAWVYVARQESTRAAAIDLRPESLGYIWLTSADRGADGRWTLNGTVALYDDRRRYDQVAAQLVVRSSDGRRDVLDLSKELDAAQVGRSQGFAIAADTPGVQVVACLRMPHPRLAGTYRVIDVYSADPSDDRQRFFHSVAATRVVKEEGQPCE